MRNFVKILITATCLYVFIAKIYVIIYYVVIRRHFDIPVRLVDFVALFSCMFLSLIIWQKIHKIKYKVIWMLFLLVSIFIQFFSGLFDYFSKDPRVNQIKVLWTFDIPNSLSVFVMGYLIFLILKKE